MKAADRIQIDSRRQKSVKQAQLFVKSQGFAKTAWSSSEQTDTDTALVDFKCQKVQHRKCNYNTGKYGDCDNHENHGFRLVWRIKEDSSEEVIFRQNLGQIDIH